MRASAFKKSTCSTMAASCAAALGDFDKSGKASFQFVLFGSMDYAELQFVRARHVRVREIQGS